MFKSLANLSGLRATSPWRHSPDSSMSGSPLDRAVGPASIPIPPSHQDSHDYNTSTAHHRKSPATRRAARATANLTDTTSRNLRAAFDALDLQADNSISIHHVKEIIPVVFSDTPPTWDTFQYSIRTACDLSEDDDPPETITFPQFVNLIIALDEKLIRTASASTGALQEDDRSDPAPSQDPLPDQSAPLDSSDKTPRKRQNVPKKEDDPFDLFHFDMSSIDNVFSMLDPSGDDNVSPTELHDTLNSLGFSISHDEAAAMVDLASGRHNARYFNNQHFHSLVRTLRSTIPAADRTHTTDSPVHDKTQRHQSRVRHNIRKSFD